MFRKEKLQLKKRKNAALKVLLLSAFITMICFSMLIGTTYAWLTDSVTSARNKIVSGSLSVNLRYYDGNGWAIADDDVFPTAAWQPGEVVYRAVQIENVGDIAIKYAFKVNVVTEYGSINTQDQPFLLSAYLVTYQHEYDTAADALAALPGVQNECKDLAINGLSGFAVKTGEIAGESSKYLVLAMYMPVSGVEGATVKAGADVPLPEFDIRLDLVAVQTASSLSSIDGGTGGSETPSATKAGVTYNLDPATMLYTTADSEGNTYHIRDKADFDKFVASINGGESFSGKKVKLDADIDLENADWPLTDVFLGTFDGNGKTIGNFKLNVSDAGTVKLLGDNATNVTVTGLTVSAGFNATVAENTAVVTVTEA